MGKGLCLTKSFQHQLLLEDHHNLHTYIIFRKFMGLILKYQIYQSFAEELMSDESDLIKHVAENSDRLRYSLYNNQVLPYVYNLVFLCIKKTFFFQ